MWLINTRTLELELFTEFGKPDYAVLSHTWADDESSFRDWSGSDTTIATGVKATKGYAKVKGACNQALADGYGYLWADTVCVDTRSSADLSEAVLSSFRCYSEAQICYAYFSDLPSGSTLDALPKCRWFTRAWTLQDLIAPPEVMFFDSAWTPFGTRSGHWAVLSSITSIPKDLLSRFGDSVPLRGRLDSICIAERMSWLSQRSATRVEDLAYSMLGLFGIAMPILYGEGPSSWARLQRAIVQQTTDQSLLAWQSDAVPAYDDNLSMPIFAQSAAQFHGSEVAPMRYTKSEEISWQLMTTTNVGMTLKRPVISTLTDRLIFALLNCVHAPKTGWHLAVWMPLWRLDNGAYRRIAFPATTIRMLETPANIGLEVRRLHLQDFSNETHRSDSTFVKSTSPGDGPLGDVGVLVALPGGITAPAILKSFPAEMPDARGTFWLRSKDNSYFYGLLVFPAPENPQYPYVGIFFAFASVNEAVSSWTCRVLLNLTDASLGDLEAIADNQLAAARAADIIPTTGGPYQSPVWRRRDQEKSVFVELDNSVYNFVRNRGRKEGDVKASIFMARVIFDCSIDSSGSPIDSISRVSPQATVDNSASTKTAPMMSKYRMGISPLP